VRTGSYLSVLRVSLYSEPINKLRMSRVLTQHIKGGSRTLPPLENITMITPLVTRILAQNGGPYTLQGTNTYLVGKGSERLLIDTGSGNPEYIPVLKEAMNKAGCETLKGIIITHWHHDHLGGVPSIQQVFGNGNSIPVYKFMPKEMEKTFGKGEGAKDPFTIWPENKFVPLQSEQKLFCEGATLRMVHTPGHANDHIVIVLEEEGSMFSGDNVLGTGTGVFRDLGSYIRSLNVMLNLNPKSLYPGHGPVVADGPALIKEYISHRMKRLDQVKEILSRTPLKAWTSSEIVQIIYPSLPENLVPPATYNTMRVLQALQDDGKAEERTRPEGDSVWALVKEKL